MALVVIVRKAYGGAGVVDYPNLAVKLKTVVSGQLPDLSFRIRVAANIFS